MQTDMEVRPDTRVGAPAGSLEARAAQGPWIWLAAVAAVGFVLVGLSAWKTAPQVVAIFRPPSPVLTLWAIRCGSVAVIAAAQLVLVGFVADGIYGRDRLSTALRYVAGSIMALAAVSAIVLVVAGRFVAAT